MVPLLSLLPQSEGPNICSVLIATLHHGPHLGIPTLSPLAPAYPSLLPVQVKHEETPISLQTLCQSQSLWRVKKESWSPSLLFLVGPHHQLHSPPCLQSLTYVALPPQFLQCLHHCRHHEAALRISPHEVNTTLTSIELKVQVALSLLDGDACTWATPLFAQLVSVQIGARGATTPFTNEAAFATAFQAHFGNLDDETAAQVELAKLCADKSMHEKCTAAEFSMLFKGLADHSGYGDLEFRDKYLSGILSHVYRKIELETFTTWEDTDKCTTALEEADAEGHVVVPPVAKCFGQHQRSRRKRRLPQQLLWLREARVSSFQVPQL
ncbi:predicted protein [Postia placenta Mad-698-R]|uniref:Retrotransposon gag domain-containing protein n=1 Tax=Postia placenta MAD-698-R-SB12 TaxID=670580 RepID=A0A1X6N1W3_9APHY|nr:hypothetical protein POSPLADRAFT_1143433 [Postia placenta MAD-698-R-SB12]EED80270.1 predicted protein [Postia placenta Mad-698-R]OSX62443.1 hypothetical protein POSPLADRAFT_1143433 [Postia placenta MAD-698-R-SB12]